MCVFFWLNGDTQEVSQKGERGGCHFYILVGRPTPVKMLWLHMNTVTSSAPKQKIGCLPLFVSPFFLLLEKRIILIKKLFDDNVTQPP